MGDYAKAAEFYDLIYSDQKDYPAEAALVGVCVDSDRARSIPQRGGRIEGMV